ncbi:MAG TPA: efflux transporter outer membrane subunit [Steroidobacteraceae bacterium]|jgi:outer membrane protein, multidrug efflux system|nr:efflux transporter outer membrane subunit [Steroidobacteraceae bacterium]
MSRGAWHCRVAAGLLVACVLGGCVIGQDYTRPALDLPEKFRFADPEARDVANTLWWEQFGDPALDELIASALANNLDVRIAAARVEEFYGALGVTRSGFFPQVGADFVATRELIPPATSSSDRFQADVFAAWELDVFGRLRRLTEASRADLLASEEGRRFAVLSLISAVASGYIALRTLDSQVDIARRTVQSRADALTIFEARHRRGAISELELSQQRSEYTSALATVPRLEVQQAQTENALAVLIGRNPGPIARAKTIEELALPFVPAGLPSELLERRPDLRQAELNLVSANARIGAAKALYFPSISLTGLLGSASNAIDNLFTEPAELWSYAGTVSAPIFTGGNIRGQVAIAEARQQQVLFAYRKAIQSAFQEVDDALIADQKSREELAAQTQGLEALRTYTRLARMRYDNGYSSYLEVLDAERALFSAELDYARVRSDTYFALIDLYKAMGGGWVIEASAAAPQPRVSLTSNPPVFP